jgi:hypothetical protein
MGKKQQHPKVTRKDHERFCLIEGWALRHRADGSRRGSHHVNYEFALLDGRILFTRISHPPDRTTYGAALWAHILRDQLEVTNDEFWECVSDGILPNRGIPAHISEAIPLAVIRTLINEAHIPEPEVKAMSKDQAIARLAEFYTNGA